MKALISAALLIAAARIVHGALPVVGSPAPEITLDRLIPEQPAVNASLKALAGKAVVLEFSGTWCSGCVESIAHLNQLADEFQGRPIVFLTLMEEEPGPVEAFLRNHPIRGWVGIAQKARLFQDYGVEPVPQTFLIDPAGKVAAITQPMKLTSAMLTDLLAGRPVSAPRLELSSTDRGGEAALARPLLDMIIRPTGDAELVSGKLRGDELTLRSIISRTFLVYPEDFIEGEPLADTTKYDFSFSLPGAKHEELRALAQQLVCAAFQIKVERVRREKEVLVLTAPEGKSPGLVLNTGGGSLGMLTGKGRIKLINNGIRGLALCLRRELHQEVVDETGLTGSYDLALKWEAGSGQSLREALRTQLGLKLEPGRRALEYLVVSRVR